MQLSYPSWSMTHGQEALDMLTLNHQTASVYTNHRSHDCDVFLVKLLGPPPQHFCLQADAQQVTMMCR